MIFHSVAPEKLYKNTVIIKTLLIFL